MYPLTNILVEYMMENPFSIVHDGSSDSGINKMNADVRSFLTLTTQSTSQRNFTICAQRLGKIVVKRLPFLIQLTPKSLKML